MRRGSGRSQAVGTGHRTQPASALLGPSLEGVAVHLDQAEGGCVAQRPLKVVHGAPIGVAPNTDPVIEASSDSLERLGHISDSPFVVRGTDPVLGNQEWHALARS